VSSADESISQMEDLASPVRAFVRQRCQVSGALTISKDLLFETYKLWADKNGFPKKDYVMFARDLHTAFPMVRASRPTDPATGKRIHVFVGINLRAAEDDQ
jgi:putative DNA primase/helicase